MADGIEHGEGHTAALLDGEFQSARFGSDAWVPSNAAVATARDRAWREAHAIDRLTGRLNLRSFRAYVQATLGAMSTLAPAALAAAGFGVEEAIEALRPAPDWLRRSGVRMARRQAPWRTHRAAGVYVPRLRTELWSAADPERVADAIIHDGTHGDYLVLAVFGSSAEVRLRGAGFQILTRAGTAHLILSRPMPATVAAACHGRLVDDVVDHPLLRGRGLIVDEVHQDAGRTTLIFQAGECGLHLPSPDPNPDAIS